MFAALVNARATSETQGISAGFSAMDNAVIDGVSGGQIYNVVYPADIDQDSSAATADIINQVRTAIAGTSSTGALVLPPCMVIQGYSQGAAAVVDALQNLTDTAAMNVIKGVVLLGNPRHKPNLTCNIDPQGQDSTFGAVGAANLLGFASVPDEYISRTADICIEGDGICDTAHALGVNQAHQSYPFDNATQSTGASFSAAAVAGFAMTFTA